MGYVVVRVSVLDGKGLCNGWWVFVRWDEGYGVCDGVG